MAKEVVSQRGIAIRTACAVFSISESCYRYESKQNAENEDIANWLIRLTDNHRNWGFGLCYLYLRNVKNFGWNHKRVYRIYRELELNLRLFNVIDDFNREALGIEVDFSLPSERVIRAFTSMEPTPQGLPFSAE